MGRCKEKVYSHGEMDRDMKVNILMIINMELEPSNGQRPTKKNKKLGSLYRNH